MQRPKMSAFQADRSELREKFNGRTYVQLLGNTWDEMLLFSLLPRLAM